MDIITEENKAAVLLTDIRLGRLFQANDTVYLKTNHIHHESTGAVVNEDHTTSMSPDDRVLVVALGTGRTFFLKLNLLVTPVTQKNPIKVKVDG